MKSRCEVSTRVLLYETRLSASAGSRNTVGELPIHTLLERELARVGLARHQGVVVLVGLLDHLDRLGRVERLLVVAEAVDRLVCARAGGKGEGRGEGSSALLPSSPGSGLAGLGWLAGGRGGAPSGVLYQRNHSRMPETVPG